MSGAVSSCTGQGQSQNKHNGNVLKNLFDKTLPLLQEDIHFGKPVNDSLSM
jgi:hypothetical protein